MEAKPSWGIGLGPALGAGPGAGWGLVVADRMGGDPVVGLAMGTLGGGAIALVSVVVVYRTATAQ